MADGDTKPSEEDEGMRKTSNDGNLFVAERNDDDFRSLIFSTGRQMKVNNVIVHEYVQTDSTVTIKVPVSEVGNHPKDMITVIFKERCLKMEVYNLRNMSYSFIIASLYRDILPEKCSYKVTRDCVELTLVKGKPKLWDNMYACHKSAKQQWYKIMEDILRPYVGRPSQLDVFNRILTACWRFAQAVNDNGIDFVNLPEPMKLKLPKPFMTLDELIDHIAVLCQRTFSLLTDDDEQLCWLSGVLLVKLNQIHSANEKLTEEKAERVDKARFTADTTEQIGNTGANDKTLAENFKLKGNEYYYAKMYHEAISSYTEALKLDPICAVYLVNRAACYAKLGKFEDCFYDSLAATNLDPRYVKGIYYYGVSSLNLGVLELAIVSFEAALEIEPENTAIEELLKKAKRVYYLCEKANDCAANMDSFQAHIYRQDIAGLGINWRNGFNALKFFKKLFDRYDIKKIKVMLKDMIKTDPYNVDVWYHMGKCHFYEDSKADAISCLEKCIEICSQISSKGDPFHKELLSKVKSFYSYREKGDQALKDTQVVEALQWFGQALQVDSNNKLCNYKLYIEIGQIKVQQQDYEEAIKFFSMAVELLQDKENAYLGRAQCYQKLNHHHSAIVDYEKLFKIAPNEKNRNLLQDAKNIMKNTISDKRQRREVAGKKKLEGNKLYIQGNYNAAIEYYKEAIYLDPECPDYYSNRSACYIQLENFQKGLKDAKTAVKINPCHIKALLRVGICCNFLGDPEAGLSALQKAYQLDTQDGKIFPELRTAEMLLAFVEAGRLAKGKKDFSNAAAFFTKAWEIAIFSVALLEDAVECLILSNQTAIVKDMPLKCSPGKYNLALHEKYICGMCYYYEGNLPKADEILSKVLSLDSSYTKVKKLLNLIEQISDLFSAGDGAFLLGNLVEAQTCYNRCLKMDPQNFYLNAKLYYEIGNVKIAMNNMADAVTSFTSAINLRNDYLEAYLKRAKCYLRVKEYEKAVYDYKEIIRITPCKKYEKLLHEAEKSQAVEQNKIGLTSCTDDEIQEALTKCLCTKGESFYNCGDYSKALSTYSEVIDLNPDCPLYMLSRAKAYLALNKIKEALCDARKATELDGTLIDNLIFTGNCELLLGDAEAAIKTYVRAKELDHVSREVGIGLSKAKQLKTNLVAGQLAMKEKNFSVAASLFKIAMEIAGGDSSIVLKTAECLILTGEKSGLEEAENLLDTHRSLIESDPMFHFIHGLRFYYSGNEELCLKEFSKVSEKSTNYLEVKRLTKFAKKILKLKEESNAALQQNNLEKSICLLVQALEVDLKNNWANSKIEEKIVSLKLGMMDVTEK